MTALAFLTHPGILAPLAEHLSPAALVRLRHALGRRGAAEAGAILFEAVVSRVPSLCRKPRTWPRLAARLAKNRCRECAAPCRRKVPVCELCARSDGPCGMIDRRGAAALARAARVRGALAFVYRETRRSGSLRVARIAPGRARLYWTREVVASLSQWIAARCEK
jgi:hypothetical protein